MAKLFYWLRLKEGFFKSLAMKKLRKIAGGDTYTIIYLKLMLLSIRDNGHLFYEGIENSFEEELASALDEEVENVKITLSFLERINYLTPISAGEIFLTEVPTLIGKETDKAEIMRQKRIRERLEASKNGNALEQKGNNMEQSGNNVTESGNNVTEALPTVTECYTEKDIDIEIYKKKESKEKEKSLLPNCDQFGPQNKKPVSDDEVNSVTQAVIDHINDKMPRNAPFENTPETRTVIRKVLERGYTQADFFVVFDKRYKDWYGSPLAANLRPSIVFNEKKFEEYLHAPDGQERKKSKSTNQFNTMIHTEYDYEAIEKDITSTPTGGILT